MRKIITFFAMSLCIYLDAFIIITDYEILKLVSNQNTEHNGGIKLCKTQLSF